VGPWQPIWLEQRQYLNIDNATLNATVAGNVGSAEVALQFAPIGKIAIVSAKIVLERNGKEYCANVDLKGSRDCVARISVPQPDLWWPHTHGDPALYSVKAIIISNDGATQLIQEVALGHIGFRTLALNTDSDDFELSVNGVPIFCRGACWTPIDLVTFAAQPAQYASAIKQVRDAGMNMLRISGTMVYESDEFLDLCDQNGILLWQDFMFANMDYPEDEKFIASVTTEVQQQLAKLGSRACVAVLCGNSEVEQQAAMWGAVRELWTPRLFHTVIADLANAFAPGVPYWPSSAHGGAIPHQPNVGTTSYYGVGAYLRSTEDARRSDVKFATECLAFANIPEDSAIEKMPRGLALRVHHPEWKSRTPRDLGAGWDFEDVRDFYLRELFNVDPMQLRYADHDRYLDLGRVACGEAIAAAFREWRRKRSVCTGALIWFLRDLWPGAGWGVLDAHSSPKSPYYFLRRLLQPKAVFLTNEGNNGVFVHLVNETAEPLQGNVAISLYRLDEISVGNKLQPITIPARTTLELPVAAFFEGFMDLSYAYRFGPPTCSLVAAVLTDHQGNVLARDFYFPIGHAIAVEPDIGLSATAQLSSNGDAELAVQSKRAARFVTVQADGFEIEDQYFHLAPGVPHRVQLRRIGSASSVKGQVKALNSTALVKIVTAQ
jgi:beta-mannosidase